MNFLRITSTLALGAALAACGANQSDEGDAPPDPDPSATPGDAPTEQVSILRPDVEAEQPAPVVKIEALEVTIGFPEGGDELDAAAIAALREVLTTPQIELGGPVTLAGHSDTGGSDAVNLRASTMRAEAVRDWLIENGIAEDRFEIIAFGEQNPAEPNALPDGTPNEEGRAANRRVEILVPIETEAPSASDDGSAEAGD